MLIDYETIKRIGFINAFPVGSRWSSNAHPGTVLWVNFTSTTGVDFETDTQELETFTLTEIKDCKFTFSRLFDVEPEVKPAETSTETGVKYDSDKPQYRLVPPYALEEIAKNLTYGSRKYSAFNWIKVPNAKDRYMDAAIRHIEAYRKGETNDPENGYSHLAAAAVNLMFLIEFDINPELNKCNTTEKQ